MNLKGKDYLQVAHRLVWMREEHPDWSILTEYVFQNEKSALAKATILDASGRIMAMSHKEESLVDFPLGYREKAETGAIGRALALCGYGTQFEPDFDEGSRVVDGPLPPKVGNISPDQPAPGDGVQEEGVAIKYGPFAKKMVHAVIEDPRFKKHIAEDCVDKWKARGLSDPPSWAIPMIDEIERLAGPLGPWLLA